MTLDQLILKLQHIRAEVGDDLEVWFCEWEINGVDLRHGDYDELYVALVSYQSS